MGTPEFAVASLEVLVREKMNVIGVVTVPDKQAGRGQSIHQSDVKQFAIKNNLKLLQPANLKDSVFLSDLKSLNPDIIIVVAFRMLPELVWKMPRLGTINLHASLLPNYRGAAPINWAIINGETETGVTTFFINKDIDTGKIILQHKIKIETNYSAGELHDKLMYIGAELLITTIKDIVENKCTPIDQNKVSLSSNELKNAPKINKADCMINWNKRTSEIYNFIRGLSPYPGAYAELISPESKKYFIKIFKSSITNKQINDEIGTIITDQKTFLNIATTDGLVSLQEVQLTGRKKMRIDEFLRGFPLKGTWKF